MHQSYLANEGTGAVVWDSEVAISRFLDVVGERGCLRGKVVIELGAGLAMACFVAAAHAAATVATDIDANMYAIFQNNLHANKVSRPHPFTRLPVYPFTLLPLPFNPFTRLPV